MNEARVYILIIILTGMALLSLNQVSEERPLGKKTFIAPPQFIRHLTFGYHESMADSLWIRLLQDLEVCGKSTISRQDYEGMIKDSSATKVSDQPEVVKSENQVVDENIFKINEQERVCVQGWAFRLLDAITQLAPQFRMPYAAGATALSVIVNDHLGAKIIFDKGVKQFPKDWPILYRAAYHYLYEMRDLEGAARLLSQAGENGAPSWVKSLAARLYSRTGQVLLGLTTLKSYYHTVENPKLKEQLLQRIKKLEAHLAQENQESQE